MKSGTDRIQFGCFETHDWIAGSQVYRAPFSVVGVCTVQVYQGCHLFSCRQEAWEEWCSSPLTCFYNFNPLQMYTLELQNCASGVSLYICPKCDHLRKKWKPSTFYAPKSFSATIVKWASNNQHSSKSLNKRWKKKKKKIITAWIQREKRFCEGVAIIWWSSIAS